jgi:hypothetical protein
MVNDVDLFYVAASVRAGLIMWQQINPCSMAPSIVSGALQVIAFASDNGLLGGTPAAIAKAAGSGANCLLQLEQIIHEGCNQYR